MIPVLGLISNSSLRIKPLNRQQTVFRLDFEYQDNQTGQTYTYELSGAFLQSTKQK